MLSLHLPIDVLRQIEYLVIIILSTMKTIRKISHLPLLYYQLAKLGMILLIGLWMCL